MLLPYRITITVIGNPVKYTICTTPRLTAPVMKFYFKVPKTKILKIMLVLLFRIMDRVGRFLEESIVEILRKITFIVICKKKDKAPENSKKRLKLMGVYWIINK